MQKIIYTTLLIWILSNCQNSTAKPEKLLSLAEMQKILVDIHSLEALLLEKNYNLIDSAQVAYQDAEKGLFKKHKISYKHYKSSYDYYLKVQPEKLDAIYKAVIDTLEKREKRIPLPALNPNLIQPAVDSTKLKGRERKYGKGNVIQRPLKQQ